MSPSTNIDGTEITGATIDGQDVQEITVDGDTVFTAIPDSVVSRDPDDQTATGSSADVGIKFSTSQEWPQFQAEISQNMQISASEEMVIGDTNGTDVAVVDVSSKSAGDVVTFDSAGLAAGTEYSIYLRTGGSRIRGDDDNPSFPYTSLDGNLSIINGWFDGATNPDAYGIVTIGNINL